MNILRIPPSDLSWLYDRCPRCFHMKLRGLKGGYESLPAIFNVIDHAQKQAITTEHLRSLGLNVKLALPRTKVCSKVMEFGGCMIQTSGFIDKLFLMDDDTHAVIDYKCSNPRQTNMVKYWRAMSSYQHALENPDTGEPIEISHLGLVVFNPSTFVVQGSNCALKGQLQRIDIEVDRAKYQKLLTSVGESYLKDELPPSGKGCDVCKHATAVAKALMAAGAFDE